MIFLSLPVFDSLRILVFGKELGPLADDWPQESTDLCASLNSARSARRPLSLSQLVWARRVGIQSLLRSFRSMFLERRLWYMSPPVTSRHCICAALVCPPMSLGYIVALTARPTPSPNSVQLGPEKRRAQSRVVYLPRYRYVIYTRPGISD